MDKLTRGNTQILKFNAKDKKEIGIKNNYAIQQGSKIKSYRTLKEVNQALGSRYTSKSFQAPKGQKGTKIKGTKKGRKYGPTRTSVKYTPKKKTGKKGRKK